MADLKNKLSYGRKGTVASFSGAGAIVTVVEIDPICALQASMDGHEVKKMKTAIGNADIIVTATGNKDILKEIIVIP